MAKETFAKAMPYVFSDEGGYADNPKDPGGATNLGVTLATLSAWRGRPVTKAEVKALSRDEAQAIYKAQYWDTIKGDDLPAGIDYAMFDFSVNSGPARAVKLLQKTVGVDQDGVIGAKTLTAVRKLNPKSAVNALCDARLSWLRSLSTFKTFGKGWTSRVGRVRSRALSLASSVDPAPIPARAAPTAKAVQSDASLVTVIKRPEAWGPLGGLITGVSSMASGSGPMQWALAAAMVALVGVGLWFFIRRVRQEA